VLNDWTDVLLLHLLRDAKSIERLAGKLEPGDISSFTMDNFKGFLWKCSKEYFVQYNSPIPQHFLVSQLVEAAQVGGMQQDEIDRVGALVDFIYNVPETQFNYEIALQSARKLLEQVRVQTPVQDMLQDGADVSQIFEAFQAGLSASTVSMAEAIDPLASWELLLGTTKPVVIGGNDVQYFNTMVNGGLCPGEIVIILGPMGGFKTTMAIDIVCSMAKLQHYSAFMSYEQSYRGGDLPIRFMARLSGVARDTLMTCTADKLPEEHKKALKEAQAYSKYAMFFDRSTAIDKVEDLASQVRDLQSVGKKPGLMVIDQLMTWMQQWPEASSKDKDWFRKESTAVIKKLKTQICEKYGMNIVVLHQITAGAIGKQGGQSFGHTDSAENKGICFWSDFGLTIGTKNEAHNVFSMNAGKARRGGNQKLLIQAIPETCKFRYAKEWQEDPRTGKIVQVGSRTLIPKVPPPKPPGSVIAP
jgi:hypothetical protein